MHYKRSHIELITKERWKKLQNSFLTQYLVIRGPLVIFWDIFTMKRRGKKYFLVSRDWLIGILSSYTYRDIKSDFQALFNILLYFYLIWKLLQFYAVQYIELFFSVDCEDSLYENSRIQCSFCMNVIDTIKIWILQEISSHFFWAPSLYWCDINVILNQISRPFSRRKC